LPSVDGQEASKLDPRSILSFPSVYRLFSMLIGAHRSRIISVEQYIRPKASDRVLDCGCGPAILLEYLPDVEYVGIDIDEKYIAQSRRRYGDRATFRLGPVGEETIQEEDHYDLVLAWGLLHHRWPAGASSPPVGWSRRTPVTPRISPGWCATCSTRTGAHMCVRSRPGSSWFGPSFLRWRATFDTTCCAFRTRT